MISGPVPGSIGHGAVRQSAASARLFFVDMLGRADWTVFGQIRAKDEDTLPAVLSREPVIALLRGIRWHGKARTLRFHIPPLTLDIGFPRLPPIQPPETH